MDNKNIIVASIKLEVLVEFQKIINHKQVFKVRQ